MKLLFAMAIFITLFAAGCGEITYPKANLTEAVTNLCEKEYGLNVDVSLVDNTLAIYLPLMHLFDAMLSLSEKAQDEIQNVLLGASRVVLSTDAEIRFYCVIAQDIKLPEIQLVIIKYTDDIKRAFYHDISRGEYFKRTIIDMNENPQAKKEKAITDVFEKMQLDEEMQEKVLDDFFRSEPSSLGGIGYWNGKFYIKNITLKEFLAQQMAGRIKMKFGENKALRSYALKMITGRYEQKEKISLFLINFSAEPLLFVINPDEKLLMEKEIFKNAVEEVSDVIYGYKFKEFDAIKIIEENTDAVLSITKDDIYSFKQGKIGLDTIIGAVN